MSTLTLLPMWVQSLIGWGVPAELSLHIQPPRVQRGGCWLGHLFLFPNGREHGQGSYQYPGVSPEILRPGYK